jgi:purine-cytosine permease-like protein
MFWTLVGFAAYTVAGVSSSFTHPSSVLIFQEKLVGREHFADILSNFLSILSYWTAFFVLITLEEHFLFRGKNGTLGGYNLDDWDSPSKCDQNY